MDINKTHQKALTEENNSLLGKKRSNDLSTNYLFRRFLTGEIANEYEINSIKYTNLLSFNWDDDKIVKPTQHPSIY
mgnify:CR=1 FL=1